MDGSREASRSGRLRRQVGGQRWERLAVARIVGKLDGDRLRVVLGDGAVQLLDGALRLDALVKADEANALGQTYEGEGTPVRLWWTPLAAGHRQVANAHEIKS